MAMPLVTRQVPEPLPLDLARSLGFCQRCRADGARLVLGRRASQDRLRKFMLCESCIGEAPDAGVVVFAVAP